MASISLSAGFPQFVNEKAARVVAAQVAIVGAVATLTDARWLAIPLAVGFVARVLWGPRASLFGRVAQAVAPRLGSATPVPGPPKRFAQGVGAVFTIAASLAWALGASGVAAVLLAVLTVFATLEAVFGFCAGCVAFGLLIRAGVIPESVCVECGDLSLRRERLQREADIGAADAGVADTGAADERVGA